MKKLSNPIILLLFIIISIFLYSSLDANIRRSKESQQNVTLLESSVIKQEQEISNLEKQLETSQHPLTQEKIIRDELLLQKEGEVVFKLPAVPDVSPTTTPAPAQPSPWQEWQALLFSTQ